MVNKLTWSCFARLNLRLFQEVWNNFSLFFSSKKSTEMLAELSRREKEAKIKPDPDIDVFMKVR